MFLYVKPGFLQQTDEFTKHNVRGDNHPERRKSTKTLNPKSYQLAQKS